VKILSFCDARDIIRWRLCCKWFRDNVKKGILSMDEDLENTLTDEALEVFPIVAMR